MELKQRFDEGLDYKMLKNSSTLDLEAHLKLKKSKYKKGFKVFLVKRLVSQRRLKNEVKSIYPAFMFLMHYCLQIFQTAVESVKMLGC